jgi:uncharacterized protein (TIGR03435 family)
LISRGRRIGCRHVRPEARLINRFASTERNRPNGPSIFTAVREQLGLKLESTKGRIDVLAIDHVEQPSPD